MNVKNKTVIDNLTGEVLSESTEIIQIKNVSKDTFINVYLNDLSGLMNIKNQTELRILA